MQKFTDEYLDALADCIVESPQGVPFGASYYMLRIVDWSSFPTTKEWAAALLRYQERKTEEAPE